MRTLPALLLAAAITVTAAGCGASSEAQTPVAVPKECADAPTLIGAKMSQFSASAEKPKDLEKHLAGAATEVEAMAATVADVEVKAALQDFATSLKTIKVTGKKSAIDGTQKAIAGGTDSMEKIAKACA